MTLAAWLTQARKVAKAATPGPWHPMGTTLPGIGVYSALDTIFANEWGHSDELASRCVKNAAHIATFDPATAMAMLDVIEAAQKYKEIKAKSDAMIDAMLSDVEWSGKGGGAIIDLDAVPDTEEPWSELQAALARLTDLIARKP